MVDGFLKGLFAGSLSKRFFAGFLLKLLNELLFGFLKGKSLWVGGGAFELTVSRIGCSIQGAAFSPTYKSVPALLNCMRHLPGRCGVVADAFCGCGCDCGCG